MMYMFKKILKKSLYLLIPFFAYGLYVYIFPIYPDYNIPEEYFHTRFHDEWFDSPWNGFHAWKELIEWLKEHKEIILEFDRYYKCFLEDNCIYIDEHITQIEKNELLAAIKADEETLAQYQYVVNSFLRDFENITEDYSYISTLNFALNENWEIPVWAEIIVYTRLLELSRGIIFYNHISQWQTLLNNTIQILKNFSWLSYNLDDSIITYLILMRVLEKNYMYIKNHFEELPPHISLMLWRNVERYQISDTMLQNGIKTDHQFWKKIIESIYASSQKDFKTRFFFDLDETLQIMKKIDYERIEWDCSFVEINNNWKNWIWRTLSELWNICMQRQLRQQSDLLQLRWDIIDLLSN